MDSQFKQQQKVIYDHPLPPIPNNTEVYIPPGPTVTGRVMLLNNTLLTLQTGE